MIVILKPNASEEKLKWLLDWLHRFGVSVETTESGRQTVLILTGDTAGIDAELVAGFDMVDCVRSADEPYRCSGRGDGRESTVIEVGGAKIGGGHFAMIAGPCSVESEEQIVAVAKAVKAAGADILRGGAFKPRTSPYDFDGLKDAGLALLKLARAETGLPIVSEIMGVHALPLFEDVDILQVGARNMQNYELLRELGRLDKPILLKRGFGSTLRELLLSAEYIMAGGNGRVILCERGIRTFDDFARNTLDLAAVPMLHELSHLPVIVDPSHATGVSRLIPPMAMAACACGADGLMLEVHNDPLCARCDGAQALYPEEYAALARKVREIRRIAAE